ncbi:hypothetical protein L861_15635 [Litchfieldella anticariensis FP35 = DSM 16096]|uniref:Uncharacterized protein n=1 Tax=Litchfieldella anticariensis (strain DSM 16096 / CECT 5854 / CIP 108499 / LMG 22089 / FP35) TaxID=1121939 RepID=S2KJK5_LITA3|nr:hypothetical protein L861_15635 [Halomonas anticariensis FP35 = DSM 16096]
MTERRRSCIRVLEQLDGVDYNNMENRHLRLIL